MGLLNWLENAGNSYLDRGVNASLAGVPPGLLNTAQTGQGPMPEGSAPMMSPQDRHNLRMNYLMHLGQGIAQGSPAAHLDDFRNDAVNSAIMGQQLRQQQQLQGAMANAFSDGPSAQAPPVLGGAAPPIAPPDGASAAPGVAAPGVGGVAAAAPLSAAPVLTQKGKLASQLRKAATAYYMKGAATTGDSLLKQADELDKSEQNQGPPIVGPGPDGNPMYFTPKVNGAPTPTGIAAPPEKDRYVAVGTTHILDHTNGKLTALPKDDEIVEVNGVPAIQKPDLSFTTLSGDVIDPKTVTQYNPKPGPEKVKSPDQVAFESALTKTNGDPLAAYRLVKADPAVAAATAENRAARQSAADQTRSDNSYKFSVGQLDNIAKPTLDIAGRIARLQDTLSQNSPQADALVAPQLLTVMAGGQGSGLRMNESEIARIVGGRSQWETLRAAAAKWSVDPSTANSITPSQRQQIRTLIGAVADKLQAKQQLITDAQTQLLGTQDPLEHRRIVSAAKQSLLGAPTAPTTPKGAATHRYNPVTQKIEEIQ